MCLVALGIVVTWISLTTLNMYSFWSKCSQSMRRLRAESISPLTIFLLAVLSVATDAVRLFQENGFKENSHFYHTGEGSHAYHVNTETVNSIYFKCYFYHSLKCNGRAILRIGGGFRVSNEHNHPPDTDLVARRHFRENVLNEVREGRFVSFHEILESERRKRKYSRTVRRGMTMRKLGNSMYRARMKSFPQPGPQSLAQLTQILLQDKWRTMISCTIDKDDNLYCGSTTATDGSHHVAFISERMRRFASRVTILQADGTFRARPRVPESAQVFVLATPWRSVAVPIGWILMEKKSLSAYRAVINLLKQVCPGLNPSVIVTDWEYAQQRAWRDSFPSNDARVQGCLWHLCRAFVKKANKLHLLRFKADLPLLMDAIRKTCAIALLPARFFLVGLGIIKREVRNDDLLVAYLLEPFFNYVENKWVLSPLRRRFMTLYNSMHRTNNVCETLNKVLRKAVGPYRPNIWAFIDALARLEHTASLNIEALDAGEPVSRTRKWQSVFADRSLAALCNDLRMDVPRGRNQSVANFLNRAYNLFISAYDAHVRHFAGN